VFKELVLHLSVIFAASGYTVWDRRNALLPRKVNIMIVLKQFDKNIQRLNKLNSQK